MLGNLVNERTSEADRPSPYCRLIAMSIGLSTNDAGAKIAEEDAAMPYITTALPTA